MSFDIFFQPLRYGTETVEMTNPFTGEVVSGPANEPLSPAELKAVKAVLNRVHARRGEESDSWVVALKDGGGAEIFTDGLERGCMIAIRGLTPNLTQFLFDFLKAGNWGMLPAMEETVVITATPQALTGVPDDFPEVVVCQSANELDVLLSKGVRAWQAYRDHVVGRQP